MPLGNAKYALCVQQERFSYWMTSICGKCPTWIGNVLSACVAAVKSRPVLHHCVVIFFCSSEIMECTCMLFTFENGVPLMR